MKLNLNHFKICLIFSLIIYTTSKAPPYHEPKHQINPSKPELIIINNTNPLSPKKRLQESEPSISIQNSSATIHFFDEYQTIEHKIILLPKNLQGNNCFKGYSFPVTGTTLKDISSSCEIINKSSKKECTATYKQETNKIIFSFKGNLCTGDTLTLYYKYNEMKNTKEILYKVETVVIPIVSDAIFCDYTYIIPEGFINLGLKNNILTKKSNTTYTYYGQCPTETKTDQIRYSPEKVYWNANTEISLEYPTKFTSEVIFIFPRYYLGGKIKNKIYQLSSLENDIYKESNYIYDYTKYKFQVYSVNKKKVGVKLITNFTNNLNEVFSIYFPDSYYKIDTSTIDKEIIDKANEIIKEKSDKPNYYKLGNFVNSYMTYDTSYAGKELTLKEIYEGKKGVCEHYTLLYNAMLNAIGIKTLYLSGWAFSKSETSGNKETGGHAWTAALIDNKWKELDATWGLFEGVPAGHVLKNFGDDKYYTSYSAIGLDKSKFYFYQNFNINMIEYSQESENPNSGKEKENINKTEEIDYEEEEETNEKENNKEKEKEKEDIKEKEKEIIKEKTENPKTDKEIDDNKEKEKAKETDEDEDIRKIILNNRSQSLYQKLFLVNLIILYFDLLF